MICLHSPPFVLVGWHTALFWPPCHDVLCSAFLTFPPGENSNKLLNWKINCWKENYKKIKPQLEKMIGVDSWRFGKSVIFLFRGLKLDTGVFIEFFNDFQVQMSCDLIPNLERDILMQDILESWSSWSRRTAPATTRTAASRALRWKRNWTLYPAPGWDFDYDEIKYIGSEIWWWR